MKTRQQRLAVGVLGIVGLVFCGVWTSPTVADVPTTAPSLLDDEPSVAQTPEEAARIQALIKDLGDGNYQVREKATQELIRLGEGALPAVRDAMGSDDAEVKDRATRIAREVEEAITGNGANPLVPGFPALRVKAGTATKEVLARDFKGRRVHIVQNQQGIDISVTAVNPDNGEDAVFQCRAKDAEDLKSKDSRLYRFFERVGGGPTLEWQVGGIHVAGGGIHVFGSPDGADDLPTLRLRLRGQMKVGHTPEDQKQEVWKLLQDVQELRAPRSNEPDDVKGFVQQRDRACDALWKKMDELKLADPGAALLPPTWRRLNAGVVDWQPEGQDAAAGVRVMQVFPSSRGEKIGLAPDDIIRKVNQKDVHSVQDLRRAVVREKGLLVIEVLRDGQTVELREKEQP